MTNTTFKLEILKDDDKWMVWTRGSLEDVLSDFFYQKEKSSFDGLRIVWEKVEWPSMNQ